MAARALRAVGSDDLESVMFEPESPTSAQPPTVKRAAGMTRRDLLVALRDNIAGQIDEGIQPRDLAALSKRLLDIAKEIENLDADTNGDEVGNAAETADEQWDADGG